MKEREGVEENEVVEGAEETKPDPEVKAGQHVYYFAEASGLEEVMEGCVAKGLKFLNAKRLAVAPMAMLQELSEHQHRLKEAKLPENSVRLPPAYVGLSSEGIQRGAEKAAKNGHKRPAPGTDGGIKAYVQRSFFWRVKGVLTPAYTPAAQ